MLTKHSQWKAASTHSYPVLSGVLKLADFSCSKQLLPSRLSHSLELCQTSVGTPYWYLPTLIHTAQQAHTCMGLFRRFCDPQLHAHFTSKSRSNHVVVTIAHKVRAQTKDHPLFGENTEPWLARHLNAEPTLVGLDAILSAIIRRL